MSSATTGFFKIILVGDATVGKTHLLSRFVRKTLPKAPQATIGVEFSTHMVTMNDGAEVKAQLWDTAGQERYSSITRAHYRRAVGALLVYDITKMQTFINAAKWLEEVRQHAEPDIVVMMVGNKLDLVDADPSAREVPHEKAAQFAAKHGLLFYEASAVSTHNVTRSFEDLLQNIYDLRRREESKSAKPIESGTGIGLGATRSGPYGAEEGGIRLTPAQSSETQKELGCCGIQI